MGTATGRPRGRPPGSKNKRTAAVKEAARATVAAVQAKADPDTIFHGDAHALFVLVYQDTTQPMDVRLEAASKAIRFEKPALAAVDVTQDINATVRDVTDQPITAEQWSAEVGARH